MSRYEWERGTIVIPTAQWAQFRRALIEFWNQEHERLFVLARAKHAEIVAHAKTMTPKERKAFDWSRWLRERMRGRNWGSDGESQASWECDIVERLLGLVAVTKMVDGKWVAVPAKLHPPLRKHLPTLPIGKGATLDVDEARIVLDDDKHSVSWNVSENNHACDTARSLSISERLFALLGRITWTRGSGGKIVGNDEYNGDRDEEGAGGNYVTAEYGPDRVKSRRFA